MKKFIAYFDFLGFKDFINNNSFEEQKQGMRNIYRDIELALSKRETVDSAHGRIANLSKVKINCTNFSDTVVFWTNDNSIESFLEILEISYNFNWHQNIFSFPVRGALVYGDIFHSDFRMESDFSGKYNVNSVFGKGLIDAYIKAESQDWAGTVIDNTVIDCLKEGGNDYEALLEPFAIKYKVPYKTNPVGTSEFVLRIVKGLNEESAKNLEDSIRRNFGQYKKDASHPSAIQKLENTLLFLKAFIPNAKLDKAED